MIIKTKHYTVPALLKSHPEGMTKKELACAMSTSLNSVQGMITHFRTRGYRTFYKDDHYHAPENHDQFQFVSIADNMSNKVFDVLKTAGEQGIIATNICETLSLKSSSLRSIVSNFRTKGFKIDLINQRYIFKGQGISESNGRNVSLKSSIKSSVKDSKEPLAESIRGKVLKILREAGEQGVTLEEFASKTNLSIHAMPRSVFDLRNAGYRIDRDVVTARYIFKGKGRSCTRKTDGSLVLVGAPPLIRSHKENVKPTSVPVPSLPINEDLIVIVPELFQKALDVLPEDTRRGLMDISRKVQAYNKVVKFFFEADQKKNTILSA